ncbi:diguanylate cyclase domain-containing protein [Aestuariispira insulae]|uniref:Diguanylate cyclase (GGDEF)-like protein n=1 Tax=Aestuariispira insulae TaxID=1461337 RepID=A0A3D9HPN5_9PROT|nr:diguanylate cyclase [Aestuariispira insulae]RED51432.1 diguanylate cyclase (GGDEF)-like protein [Aestuariispira insulae]
MDYQQTEKPDFKPSTSIKMRTVALLVSLLAATFLISVGSAYYFFWPNFQQIEQTSAEQNAFRMHSSIYRELENLHVFVADWANWDDTYQFVKDTNLDYMRSNLTATTLIDNSLSGIAFIGAQKQPVWAQNFDLLRHRFTRFPEEILHLIQSRMPLADEGLAGFVLIGDTVTMLSALPITDSTRIAPPVGAIIFIRPLDIGFLDKIAERLKLHYRTETLVPDPADRTLTHPLGGDQIQPDARVIWFDIPLVNSDRVYRFHVETSREITDTAMTALIWNATTVLVASILIFLAMYLALDRQIAKPLIQLSQQIVSMGRSIDCDPLAENRTDEIGLIAHEVNRMQDRILSLAVHDYLTGLPNRRLFDDRLDHTLDRAERLGKQAAVIFIDLDGFKPVNDTHGHQFGDELLIAAAKRLRGITRKSDTVARLGGDEFVMIVELDDEEGGRLETVCDKILAALTDPFLIRGQEVRITASLGCSLFPDQAREPTDLVRMADEAMYGVKHEGKASWRLYRA